MKYIIDVSSDLYAIDGTLRVPVKVGNGDLSWYNTYIKAETYTEPNQEAIEDEVWEFARKVECMDIGEREEAFNIHYPFNQMSYKEAKAKYETWKKSKEEIRVGDEVIYNSRTRAVVLEPETEKRYSEIFTSKGFTIVVSHDDLEKTGRHFPEVAELLKKMKEG